MGTWGAALYEDDYASDLKDTIALIAKVPGDGERLLGLLQEAEGPLAPDDEDAATFWLVVADQFERRGIPCARATQQALRLIRTGADLDACRARGADDAFLRARTKVLSELEARLQAPRPAKPARKAGRPPALVLATGEVHAFPTMQGRAWHPYRLESAGPFIADGWGALVVLATGRAFGWIPWVALASLTVDPATKPTLGAALQARLLPHLQTEGAGRYVPKAAHAKGLGLERLGTVDLDPDRVAPHLSKWSIASAVRNDWTIAYGALSASVAGRGITPGVVLSSLCR